MITTTEKVWYEFNAQLKFFILKRIPDEQSAEDILQDVFLKIHSHIDTLRNEEKLQGWIYQIARNAIRDHYRTYKAMSPLPETLDVADQGLTQRELGEKLGISLSGAKSRVQRAREKLKTTLLDCCHFQFDRLGRVIDYQPRCDCCSSHTSSESATPEFISD